MLKKISLKNFRGLASLEVAVDQATILIGPNSCGKSTILQAVQLACTALEKAVEREHSDASWNPLTGLITLFGHGTLRDDDDLLPTRRWTDLFYGKNTDSEIVINLNFLPGAYIEAVIVSLSVGRANALRMSVAIKSKQALDILLRVKKSGLSTEIRKRGAISKILPHLKDHMPRVLHVPPFSGVVHDEEYRSGRIVGDLLRRGAQSEIVRNLLLRLDDPRDANGFLGLLGMSAVLDPAKRPDPEQVRRLEMYFQDNRLLGWLELSAAGTGLLSLLALYGASNLLLMQKSAGPRLLLLDEPEAHLHPRLQGDLAERLREFAATNRIQLMVATHSVEMIDRFGRIQDTSVLRIDRMDSTARVLATSKERMDELRAWCDLSPYSSLHLLANRRILFHEGKEDEKILRAAAKVYFAKDSARGQRFQTWLFSRLDGVSNAGAPQVLKKALWPLFKLDELQKGPPLRVVQVLDSDGKRKARFEIRNEPGYEELAVVWPGYSIETQFLDIGCLTAWIYLSLNYCAEQIQIRTNTSDKLVTPPDMEAVKLLVGAALRAANSNQLLHDEVVPQLGIALAPSRSEPDLVKGYREASELVRQQPAVYQRGHSRAHFMLQQMRELLEKNPSTCALAKAVPHDVVGLLTSSLPGGQDLSAYVDIVPPEVKRLLDYLVAN